MKRDDHYVARPRRADSKRAAREARDENVRAKRADFFLLQLFQVFYGHKFYSVILGFCYTIILNLFGRYPNCKQIILGFRIRYYRNLGTIIMLGKISTTCCIYVLNTFMNGPVLCI